MRWPLVLLLIAAALFLLSRLRLGGSVLWNGTEFTVRARVGLLRVQVWPLRNKKRKPAKAEAPKPDKPPKTPEAPASFSGIAELLETWLPLVCEAVGRLRRAIRVDLLELRLTVGGSDPGDTALLYGGANALLGMILPLFEHAFQVRERRISTSVDFEAESTRVHLRADISLTLGQLVVFTFWFLPQAARRLDRGGDAAPSNEKEAINHGK